MRIFGKSAVYSCVVPGWRATTLNGRSRLEFSSLPIILRVYSTGHAAAGVDRMNKLVAFLIARFFKLNLSIDGVDRSWVHN